MSKFCKEQDPVKKENLHVNFKLIRNRVTKLKRESKITYYNNFFEINKNKSSIIWKGIRSLVNIRSSSKKIISLIDENGSKIIIPLSISTHFNKYFASVGANIEKKIPKTNKNFRDYLRDIHIDKSSFLTACSSNEIYEIILTFDIKKSNDFFLNLSRIVNLCFETGIFPHLCKIAKVIPVHKKDDPSLLPIFSKILEKLIYKRSILF